MDKCMLKNSRSEKSTTLYKVHIENLIVLKPKTNQKEKLSQSYLPMLFTPKHEWSVRSKREREIYQEK